jgi:putative acetyltransferase
MKIRPETTADYPAIRKILIAAFANHPYSHQTEHLIVEALREANALSIGLVAVDDDSTRERPATVESHSMVETAVVGHIAFSVARIAGQDCGWFMLGPIAVEPKRQRQGIGKALVSEGLRRLGQLGAQGCVLVGDPAYYKQLGFRNEAALTMKGVPPEVILCLPLAGQVPRGELTHHAAFMVGL